MAKTFDETAETMRRRVAGQRMFFVATAPLDGDGHVNVSPKGPIGTLRVLDEHTVAYLDLIGSGAETIAHLRENGRVVVMLCAFDGPPRILRLHGRGTVVTADDPRFEELMQRCDFEQPPVAEARRAVVVVEVTRVGDSCGYGVPLMSYEGRRPHMEKWATKRLRTEGPQALRDYQRKKNAESLDGLPAVELDGDGAAGRSAVEA